MHEVDVASISVATELIPADVEGKSSSLDFDRRLFFTSENVKLIEVFKNN